MTDTIARNLPCRKRRGKIAAFVGLGLLLAAFTRRRWRAAHLTT